MPLGEHIGKQIYVSFKTTGSKWGGGMSLIGTLVGIERDIQLIEINNIYYYDKDIQRHEEYTKSIWIKTTGTKFIPINDIVYIDTTLDTNIILKG